MSAKRDYEHEEFRPWYLADTARWLRLSLGARGLAAELVRKFDRKGKLRLAEPADLEVLLRVPWSDLEPALNELVAAGRVIWDADARVLFDPDFETRMRQGSAARMARLRARRASDAGDESDVTPVTPRTVTSRDVTSDLISSDLSPVLDLSPEADPDRPTSPPMRAEEADQPVDAPGASETRVRAAEATGVTPAPSERPGAPASAADGAPPAWWQGAVDAAAMAVGDIDGIEARWLSYRAARERKCWPMNHGDAVGWLCDVVRTEKTRAKDRPRARAGPVDTRQPVRGPEPEYMRRQREKREAWKSGNGGSDL